MKTFENKQEALQYLQTLSLGEIMDLAATMLIENSPVRRISLTREQFERYFRIIGLNDAGEPETRGRKRKSE